MPSETGSVRTKRVPAPGVLVTAIWPPRPSTVARTTSSPTPRPELSLTVLRVDRAGAKMWSRPLEASKPSRRSMSPGLGASAGMSPAATAASWTASAVDAGAVVGNLDDHRRPGGAGPYPDRRRFGLAGGDALLRRLAAMVDGVGDEVAERLADGVEHPLVEFDVLALEFEVHELAGAGRRDRAPGAGTRRPDARAAPSPGSSRHRAAARRGRRGPRRAPAVRQRPAAALPGPPRCSPRATRCQSAREFVGRPLDPAGVDLCLADDVEQIVDAGDGDADGLDGIGTAQTAASRWELASATARRIGRNLRRCKGFGGAGLAARHRHDRLAGERSQQRFAAARPGRRHPADRRPPEGCASSRRPRRAAGRSARGRA